MIRLILSCMKLQVIHENFKPTLMFGFCWFQLSQEELICWVLTHYYLRKKLLLTLIICELNT